MAVFCAYITYLSTCCQISFTVSSALRPFVNAASDEFLNLFHICSSCVGSVHLKLLKHYVLLCFSEQIVDLFGSRLEYLGNLVYIFPRKPSSSKPNSSSVLYVYSATEERNKLLRKYRYMNTKTNNREKENRLIIYIN